MLCRHKPYSDDLRIILGSTSPQRQRLFRDILGLRFEAIGSSFAEDLDKVSCASAADYCIQTTKGKIQSLNRSLNFDYDLLVCADTIVVTCEGEILEKPHDRAEAIPMLEALSGRTFTVYSSCIISYRERGVSYAAATAHTHMHTSRRFG
jgi:septum formation protein